MRAAGSVALKGLLATAVVASVLLGACSRDGESPDRQRSEAGHAGTVTISGDDRISGSLTWQSPTVTLSAGGREATLAEAAAALSAGRLYDDADAAIPLYLALLQQAPGDAEAQAGLRHALAALLADGDASMAATGDDIAALRHAHMVAAVARTVAPKDPAVLTYLQRIDRADQLWELNRQAEQDLRAGRLGDSGHMGALQKLRAALRLQPGQSRAMQGLAAVESGLIRHAEDAARRGDFKAATGWVAIAAKVRSGSVATTTAHTIADARVRIAVMRNARIAALHDEGSQALLQQKGLAIARGKLAEMLRIADPGSSDVADLRGQIEQFTYYGLYRPGQHFTDALKFGARGPEMTVVPHGGFRMGAADADEDAGDIERPAHYVHFARGFAMGTTEVTVDQFRDFVRASGYRPTATRRGKALVYDESSGNFMRRNGVDWQSAYDGSRAGGSLPVIFVSARDAEAYVDWLTVQSGARYHLASESQFEYALRAGGNGRYPWGNAAPRPGAANITGGKDTSPGGRHWSNGFVGYGDGYWGPAPVARFGANAYGLHDLAGNVSEWVADCWHDSYRRAPDDEAPWINPGCHMGIVRGGSWASSPEQTRSTWRSPQDVDATNARVGFRVVRDI
ncbi:MAG: formylglycine-rating enzyme family protein [Xanthomonadaceae bacterium]|nr:formylglycine-rating enzyme family protein [Xanthomonadaceae bacterium]